jgi:MFS family permease
VASAPPRRILPVIVLALFAGAALWFAGNAVIDDLRRELGLPKGALGYVTSAVQLGFIVGTLVFAFFAVADLYSPRLVYFACSLAGAAANAAACMLAADLASSSPGGSRPDSSSPGSIPSG